MGFGPVLLIPVLIFIRNRLQSQPSKDSIMADERRHISISYSVSDGRIDEVGEESDSVIISKGIT
jgi:hypothetical protein